VFKLDQYCLLLYWKNDGSKCKIIIYIIILLDQKLSAVTLQSLQLLQFWIKKRYIIKFQISLFRHIFNNYIIFYFCFLFLPLDWPPPKSFLIFAILLFLLESLLFSLAAFLFTCLLPFDFPTIVKGTQNNI
jgi:hypothetical protein